MSDERLSDSSVLYGGSSPAAAPPATTTSRAAADGAGLKLATPAPAPADQAPAEPPRPSSSSVLYGEAGDQGFEIAGVHPLLTEDHLTAGAEANLARLGADVVNQIPTEERAQISRAFVDAGFGRTTSDAVVAAAADAFRANGGVPLSDSQVTERNNECRTVLQREWGTQYEPKMAAARATFQKAAAAYPELANVAVDLGLATNPRFIRLLEARSRRAGI